MQVSSYVHVDVFWRDFVERDDDGEVGDEQQDGNYGHSEVGQRVAFQQAQVGVLA
jgi:hypothetical protein